ncbi:MAG: tol-pal system protein YbgF [Myxococcota bacterium]
MFAIGVVALCGCATANVTRAQLDELTASVRALRADNARLESRLEKLEQRTMLAQATRGVAPIKSAPPASPKADNSLDALPPLTVVKLKPRREAAPRLDTGVSVVEPPAEVLEALGDSKTSGSNPAAVSDDPTDLAIAEAQFERALDALKTGNAQGGVQAMQQFVAEWPRHPRADNALYFAGVGLMSEGEYEDAASSFQRVTAEYPAGDAVVDAMLKLADCRLKLKQPREAKITWERIVQNYPGTAAATQAQARLSSHSAASAATP